MENIIAYMEYVAVAVDRSVGYVEYLHSVNATSHCYISYADFINNDISDLPAITRKNKLEMIKKL